MDLNENLIRLRHWPRNISERDVVTFAIVFDNERFHSYLSGLVSNKRGSLDRTCKECKRLGHEVRVEPEHSPVPGIRIDDEFAIR